MKALLSVFDKTGIVEFAQFLAGKGVEIISTGGTKRHLQEAGLNVIDISEVTNFPEMLDGRVKTLHPKIHGGLLGVRSNQEHVSTMKEHNIEPIDIVVVNLYPFFKEVNTDKSFDEKVEFIDIGGPTMIRSAAKNFQDVAVITDVSDYQTVMNEWNETGEISFNTKKRLAGKVFNLTAAYDAAISEFMLGNDELPTYLQASYKKTADLRYGENPHQKASFYSSNMTAGAMNNIEQLQGKELSFNNIRDMDVAWKIANEFGAEQVACVGLKHSTPCGVAMADTVEEAYQKAHDCDSISIFGGIVATNATVTKEAAENMNKTFLEIVIAPDFTEDALDVFKKKKNLRIIKANQKPCDTIEFVKVDGGLLVQDADLSFSQELEVVTEKQPTEEQLRNMIFGQKVVKHVKSNAIVAVKDGMAKGIGTGETNRIWAAQQAISRAEDATILASDAFFPFDDIVKFASKNGITAIIQPGGSIRDEDSIKACDELGIAMVFTGMRHFKH